VEDSSAPISREAREAAKGFRFQKLRAVKVMLKALENGSPYVYCAIENISDVYLLSSENKSATEYLEEDKNYAKETGFTLNSFQIQNSFVGFIDAWHTLNLGSAIALGFCTTASIGKERETLFSKANGIVYPSEPILKLVQEPQNLSPAELGVVKVLVKEAYKRAYSGKSGSGNLQSLESWDDVTWLALLAKISWSFEQQDEKQLEVELIDDLKRCEFYNNNLVGKEVHVISLLVDEFDRRQCLDDIASRLITKSDIRWIASRVEAGGYKVDDPVWEIGMPTIEDRRSLPEKIRAVSPDFNPKIISSWSRSVAMSRAEQTRYAYDTSMVSLRYRIFGACEARLIELVSSRVGPESEWLEYCIAEMEKCAIQHIRSLSEDYQYLIKNEQSIKGIILELIDSCFLAFDEIAIS
jgi:hypothetical protein